MQNLLIPHSGADKAHVPPQKKFYKYMVFIPTNKIVLINYYCSMDMQL